MAPLAEFHATMADVTNEQHQNMDGLVQTTTSTPRYASVSCATTASRQTSTTRPAAFVIGPSTTRMRRHVVFACVCLRASISYAIEAAYWCAKAKR